jgi:hypothetical protein
MNTRHRGVLKKIRLWKLHFKIQTHVLAILVHVQLVIAQAVIVHQFKQKVFLLAVNNHNFVSQFAHFKLTDKLFNQN